MQYPKTKINQDLEKNQENKIKALVLCLTPKISKKQLKPFAQERSNSQRNAAQYISYAKIDIIYIQINLRNNRDYKGKTDPQAQTQTQICTRIKVGEKWKEKEGRKRTFLQVKGEARK